MSKINLLPWREELRARQKKQFMGTLGVSALAGALVAGLIFFHYSSQVSGQQERNAFLEKKIEQAEKRVQEIKDLDAEKARLLSRKEVIDTLQADRSRIVRLFESLVKATPDGVVLTLVKQNEKGMLIEGRAQSNTRVSDYMRNLESSGWMKNPDLSLIEATKIEPGFEGFPYEFKLSVGLAKLEEITTVAADDAAIEATDAQATAADTTSAASPEPMSELAPVPLGEASTQAPVGPPPPVVPEKVDDTTNKEGSSMTPPPPEEKTTLTPPEKKVQP
jgi:type IV pilus assembly protein PilN